MANDSPPDWVYEPDMPLSTAPVALPSVTHQLTPSALWGSHQAPYPTNSWFLNVVLGKGEQRINVMPYVVKALSQSVSASDPGLDVTSLAVTTPDNPRLTLGASESFQGHHLARFDLLSATLRYEADSGSMEVPLVRGMAYVSGFYSGLTPKLGTGGAAITQVNGETQSPVSGTRFELRFDDGQTWVIYSSSELVFAWSSNGLTASAPFTGTLRVAHQREAAEAVILDAHASAVPVGGTVGMSVRGDDGQLSFKFDTRGDGELLMFALPHQLARIELTPTPFARATIRGEMRAVLGASWSLGYPLSTITWSAPRAIDPARKQALLAALAADKGFMPSAADPYFGGKQLAKLARLALIADELGETQTRDELLARLSPLVTSWLEGTNSHPLAYDQTWGGVISKVGAQDSGADFGQGYYNDHHFHYGYHVYAAAVLSRYDARWAQDHRERVLALVRDIANPSGKDPLFPVFRNLDLYEGHSWAAGLFEFGDGRNQESTSEAVNAWYALELYGRALTDAQLTNLGRMLRAIEVDGARTYWQIKKERPIYPAPFADQRAVGILWSTKLDFGTFFGPEPAKIYGIQMLPFTPVSEDLLDPAWVGDSWPSFEAATNIDSVGFRGFMHMAHAVIDKSAAWDAISALSDFDDGNSRTNALYWAATR